MDFPKTYHNICKHVCVFTIVLQRGITQNLIFEFVYFSFIFFICVVLFIKIISSLRGLRLFIIMKKVIWFQFVINVVIIFSFQGGSQISNSSSVCIECTVLWIIFYQLNFKANHV